MLFKDVAGMWLFEKKRFIKESTYAYYHFEVQNYINPVFGEEEIEELSEEKVQEAVVKWQNTGMHNGHPLKKSTVQNLVMLIKQIMRFAVRKRIITECTMEIHFTPQQILKERKVFNQEEQKQLIQAVLSELTYKSFGILLCINSGLRIGELCALKWKDIDLKNGTVHVTKTLQRISVPGQVSKTRIVITNPKTETSVREIPLTYKICSVIKKFDKIYDEGYMLTNSDRFIEPRTFRKYYTNFMNRHGIEPLNFHCLRHTFATRCIEKGADYKSVSEILGHTTINTTMNMYVHPQLEEKRKCVNLIVWE